MIAPVQWPTVLNFQKKILQFHLLNLLVPNAHYSERQDKPFSLQIQLLEVDLKLNCGFLFFAPLALMS